MSEIIKLPKTNTKTPMPPVKKPKGFQPEQPKETPSGPAPQPIKENTELTIQIATGPVLPGSEICICSIHNNTLQIYDHYFQLKAKMKKGTWILKNQGHISGLGNK